MLAKSQVIFNELDHTYTLDGIQLQGITSIISRQLFPDKYTGIDASVLQRAAEYGSLIHEQIELHDSLGGNTDNDVIKSYIAIKQQYNLNTLTNEYLVSDNEYVASSIDIVFDDFSLCDIKTTAHLDNEYVSWQLSIYAYLFELQNPTLKTNKLYALWLPRPKYGNPSLVEVERKPTEWVKALIEADRKGEQYYCPTTQSTDIAIPNDVITQVINLDKQLKELQQAKKELQQGLLQLMKDNNLKQFKADGLTLSVKDAYTRESIDSKKLKELYPKVYDACLTQTTVNESLTIKTT